MILKLVIAAALILLTLFAMLRVQRYLKGESGSLFEGKPKRKEAEQGPNDLEQFIESYRREKANAAGTTAPAPSGPAAAPIRPAVPATPAGAAASPAAATARRAFLAGPDKLLYLVLKAGLPDHHVFAHCRLADLLDPPPQGWADAHVDFVVCRNDLQAVAVVELERPEARPRNLAQPLAAAGIRCVQVRASALPKPADVRALVYPA
jgi:hypothetical protein